MNPFTSTSQTDFTMILLIVDDITYSKGIGFALKWRNTGRSPAINVIILGAIRTIKLTDTVVPFVPMPLPVDEAYGVFGPGHISASSTQYLYGHALDVFLRGESRLIVYSRITYETVLAPGVARCSEACFEVHHRGTIKDENGKHIDRFILRAVGSQNTAT